MIDSTDVNKTPVWSTDSEIDPSWFKEKIPSFRHISGCSVEDISNETRKGDVVKNGATLLVQLVSKGEGDDTTTTIATLVAKQVPPSGVATSAQLGLAREAIFYSKLANNIQLTKSSETSCIPKIYYSYGDMSNGNKFVIMEDLSENYVDSGILFGPGNPNNWNRDLKGKIASAYPISTPTSFDVANMTFLAIANVHATFWRDVELLKEEYNWLRGSSWVSGQGEESWKASQGMIEAMWAKYTSSDDDGKCNVIQWDPLVRQIVEKAMGGICWKAQCRRLSRQSHFTLVHGDFWPGNVMISKEKNTPSTAGNGRDLRLLDWEMVGLGSGPQELGQYILSNMDPSERRECEEQLVRNYYENLIQSGVTNLSWEYCWYEYTIGGLERWLWFLVYFCAQDGPVMAKWTQYFHNQIKEFVHDHKIRPKDVTQPRP